MNLKELKKKHGLIDLFIELCEIPSPPLKEEKVAKKILEIFSLYGIQAFNDSYGNIIAKIPPTRSCKNVPPLLLSAHMDVVGGSEEINIRLSEDERFLETDKTRTLGADDKAGIAVIIDLARKLNDLFSKVEHGPVEIIFTKDEEKGMTGVRNLDTSKLQSKYALIADGEYLGELNVEGASFTNVFIKVYKGKGGHSGINIADKTRVNALKVLSELSSKIPQGVFKENERGVITSINAAASMAGAAAVCSAEAIKDAYELGKLKKPLPEKYSSENILTSTCQESMLNVITTEAQSSYSIRSSDPENEKELLNLIKKEVEQIQKKYDYNIKVDIKIEHHLKPFVKSDDETLTQVVLDAAKANNIESKPLSFHAGAETHVLANEKKNAKGEKFEPLIIGVANLFDIHSSDERIDWKSFLEGRKWLEEIVVKFAEKHK